MKKVIMICILLMVFSCGTKDKDGNQRTPNPPDTTDTEGNTF